MVFDVSYHLFFWFYIHHPNIFTLFENSSFFLLILGLFLNIIITLYIFYLFYHFIILYYIILYYVMSYYIISYYLIISLYITCKNKLRVSFELSLLRWYVELYVLDVEQRNKNEILMIFIRKLYILSITLYRDKSFLYFYYSYLTLFLLERSIFVMSYRFSWF